MRKGEGGFFKNRPYILACYKTKKEQGKLPELEEYKEWFKEHFDLYREDGILQVTMKTKDYGEAQIDEKDMSAVHHYRYTRGENEWLQQPIRSWDDIRNDVPKWAKEHGFVEADERFAEDEDK